MMSCWMHRCSREMEVAPLAKSIRATWLRYKLTLKSKGKTWRRFSHWVFKMFLRIKTVESLCIMHLVLLQLGVACFFYITGHLVSSLFLCVVYMSEYFLSITSLIHFSMDPQFRHKFWRSKRHDLVCTSSYLFFSIDQQIWFGPSPVCWSHGPQEMVTIAEWQEHLMGMTAIPFFLPVTSSEMSPRPNSGQKEVSTGLQRWSQRFLLSWETHRET